MKINIYYGGRGLMDDPTLFVLNKMKEVLEELRVTIEVFNLYELQDSGWRDFGNNRGVVWYRRIYAAVSGRLLAVWR